MICCPLVRRGSCGCFAAAALYAGKKYNMIAKEPDMLMKSLADSDPQIAAAIDDELARQRQTIELIASENFTSPAVLEAVGTVLTNKYAEGYPSRRYYGGCERLC